MKILGVIPSRYASTRFPGKPLVDIHGKSMIRRVYEQASKSQSLDKVVVATDDTRIFDHVREFGGNVLMTSKKHKNGTSRCQEVSELISGSENKNVFDVIINIQGDEPLIDPQQIDKVAALFQKPQVDIGTLAKKINDSEELFNSNVVKVLLNSEKTAIYFSRQAVPFLRDYPEEEWTANFDFYKHIGIYGYRANVLKELVQLPVGTLEEAEKLEQLRWLENNYHIAVDFTEFEGIAIDTPDDLSKLTNSL